MKNIKKIKREFELEGLHCASCSIKIENKIKADGMNAAINFATKTLTIEFDEERDEAEIINKAVKVVKQIEPDVIVKERYRYEKKTADKKDYSETIITIVGLILYTAAFFIKQYELPLFISAYLMIGKDILLKAFKNIIRRDLFDENFLMVIATIGAFAIREYPEAVAVMIFYKIGEYFQDKAVEKSRDSIEKLIDIRPDYANLVIGKEEKRVKPEELKQGDIILVKPGEKIPVDGIVRSGSTAIDNASLTGESIPAEITAGDRVISGGININGLIEVIVEKEFRESTVSKILNLVENSAMRKSKTENFITKFAKVYTPTVVVLAILIVAIPVLAGGNINEWIYKAMIFLVVSCPCALVVSIPLSFFGGIGGASRHGILIKGSNYLEALNNVKTVILDKTGTITKGKLSVKEIVEMPGYSKDKVVEYAAIAEYYSGHPVAKAVMKEFKGRLEKEKIEKYTEISGKGVSVVYEGVNYYAGNYKMMEANNIRVDTSADYGIMLYIAKENEICGYMIIEDEVKDEAKSAIEHLKALGIENIVVLSGDTEKNTKYVADKLGITRFYGNLLPDEKASKASDIAKESRKLTLFAGDGINDAPVIAVSDVGIAMGGIGSDAAIEAADIVIMDDRIDKIAQAIKIAKKTRVIVTQNIVFALGVKIGVIVLGTIGIATMWEAVFADVGVALIAVLNAMRVLRINY